MVVLHFRNIDINLPIWSYIVKENHIDFERLERSFGNTNINFLKLINGYILKEMIKSKIITLISSIYLCKFDFNKTFAINLIKKQH